MAESTALPAKAIRSAPLSRSTIPLYPHNKIRDIGFPRSRKTGGIHGNRLSETELALARATPLPKEGRGQRMRTRFDFMARSSPARARNYISERECVCVRAFEYGAPFVSRFSKTGDI